jgi:HAMP domain-containing protein
VQVSRGKRQTTLPNAWWCAGIRRSARQQERDEAWALYSQSYRGTPKNEGFPAPSAPAASSDRVIGRTTTIDWAPLGWLVFVETPVEVQRTGLVLLGALAFAEGMFLARRMVEPIQTLRAGAARLGSGDLGQRIAIKTGDEVESLAAQSNDMAGRLQESSANLEKKVELCTQELSESLQPSSKDVSHEMPAAVRDDSSTPSPLTIVVSYARPFSFEIIWPFGQPPMTSRRFPPPWTVEETDACFIGAEPGAARRIEPSNALSAALRSSAVGTDACFMSATAMDRCSAIISRTRPARRGEPAQPRRGAAHGRHIPRRIQADSARVQLARRGAAIFDRPQVANKGARKLVKRVLWVVPFVRQRPLLPAEDISKLGVADANGLRQHCFKHELKVTRRA